MSDPDEDSLNLYADRFRWGPFGTVMAHLSFVIILLGFFFSATTGFKNTQFIVPVGSTVQVGNGTGLSVQAKSFNDDAAALQWQSDDGTHSIGKFDIPGKGLTIYVIDAASGKQDPNIKAGQIQLEVDQAGQKDPIATQVVDQGKPTTIAGITYTFERTRQFTGLIVAHDPGAPFVWIGSTLLVLGLILVFFPHRRVWVRVRTDTP